MPDDQKKHDTIDDVWPIKQPHEWGTPILDLKDTFITIDGTHYKLVDLLKKLAEQET